MQHVLQVMDLYKVYNPHKASKRVVAVNRLSFDGYAGEVLGILGPNGSGKTSTIKSIATIIDFEGGSVQVCGYDVRNRRKAVLGQLGAVLEGARNVYWTLSPIENMQYFAALKGLSRRSVSTQIEKYLSLLDLESVAKKPLRNFSKGMQQKVAIACSLMGDPRIVLLDEPTLGLDVETARTMQSFIRDIAKEDRLVLITSHDMRFIEKACSRVLVVKDGSIIAGDSVDNLTRFFRKKVYKISLENHPPQSMLDELAVIGQFRSEQQAEQLDLFYVLEHGRDLYAIFDVLRRHNAGLLSMDILQDDFEDIFMNILKNGSKGEAEA